MYKLTVIMNERSGFIPALNQAKWKHGLEHQSPDKAEKAAAELSKCRAADRVHITIVHETHHSIWRKGKKS